MLYLFFLFRYLPHNFYLALDLENQVWVKDEYKKKSNFFLIWFIIFVNGVKGVNKYVLDANNCLSTHTID